MGDEMEEAQRDNTKTSGKTPVRKMTFSKIIENPNAFGFSQAVIDKKVRQEELLTFDNLRPSYSTTAIDLDSIDRYPNANAMVEAII
jgi:hypothetical protein